MTMHRLRWSGLIWIGGVFLWLPFEDAGTGWALLLAGVGAAWAAAWFLARPKLKDNHNARRLPLAGLLAGLAVTPLAILLMAVKSGVHGHLSADFSITQILGVLVSTPFWALAGLFVGGGLALAERAMAQPGADEQRN